MGIVWSIFARTIPVITVILFVQANVAWGVPVFSTTDLFQGAAINADSGTIVSAAANLFDGNTSAMIFDDQFEGTKFVNFQPIGGPVTVGSFHIFFQRDGNSVDRAAATFHLLADTDNNGSYETALFAGPMPVVYSGTDADIILTLAAPVTAPKFRLEVTPTYTTAFPGPRVYELDAFESVPEPSTLALLGVGLLSLGFAIWRKKYRGV